MRCPYCGKADSKVIDTNHDAKGGVRRRRECLACSQRFSTYERAVLATPLLVKQDGTREEFDREKLLRGIRISCAKRPVSAADIDRLVGEIERHPANHGRRGSFQPGGGRYGHRRTQRVGPHRLHSLCHCVFAAGRFTLPAG